MKILICGFMGAGKSYWLDQLLKKSSPSNFTFLDLDQEIAKSLKITPNKLGEWITTYGWIEFRKIELQLVIQILGLEQDIVLSLGGGTLDHNLLQLLKNKENIKIVFLDTSFELCYERITSDANRPLVSLKLEELRKIFDQRRPFYNQANLILSSQERKLIEGIDALVHTLYGPK